MGVAGTAAEIADQRGADLLIGRIVVAGDEVAHVHEDAGRAVTALQRMGFLEGGLQGMWLAVLGQALNGQDPAPRNLSCEQHARLHSLTVELDRAGAADPLERAADVGAGEIEMVSQKVNEQGSGRDIRLDLLPVDMGADSDLGRHQWAPFLAR